jgi:4-alpha-glucanotransferase
MTRAPSRRAGLLVPLFSMPSSRSWGVGEIGDLEPMARWLERAGLGLLQLLPVNELPPDETSPYSALSAMAIDPQFISLGALEDFAALGGESSLEPGLREDLAAVRGSPAIDYPGVRRLKRAALARAFARFKDHEWARDTSRAAAFRAWSAGQAWWLDEYALFRALRASFDEQPWMTWPEPVRARDPAALDVARRRLADGVLFRRYLQWVAGEQWAAARRAAGRVRLFGDLPFMVGADSADVWARQDEFRLDLSVGVPPDAFSDSGQDWRLPLWRWDAAAARDFEWLRHRARRTGELFDGYRVDHLVGYYRTYVRPRDGGDGFFTPSDQEEQVALGERVLGVLVESGADITAEDLGPVPGFVRQSLARLGLPGYKVLRWEREWGLEAQPFIDPVDYPPLSVAVSGTHDTEPLAVWWKQAPAGERMRVLEIPSVQARLSRGDRERALAAPGLTPPLLEALLEVLLGSGADLVVLPVQDVFGWSDRINRPATVGAGNWTWRLRWAVDRLASEPEAAAAAARLQSWSRRYGRS